MTRDRLALVLGLLALLVGGWWLSLNSEWVDDERPRPAHGEARDNPVYALQQLMQRLGMQVERHQSLDTLPPPPARLLLLSSDWELIPERAEQLHQWVLHGGHLVLPQPAAWEDTALGEWVPVDVIKLADRERIKAPEDDAAPGEWQELNLLASEPPLWDGTDTLASCAVLYLDQRLQAQHGHRPSWTLSHTRTVLQPTAQVRAVVDAQDKALEAIRAAQGASGPAPKPTASAAPPAPTTQALRLPVGQGSVTVVNMSSRAFYNRQALLCDVPLLIAAVLQAEPGATAWIYLNEKREPLLPWLWHRGWIALLAGGLALAAALWRGAVRFGPRLAPMPRLRRSISEQVRGLGAYLQDGGREALLAAQQRALEDTAARLLPRYRSLPAAERPRAVAAATGLAADELFTAMSARACTRAELAQRLQLLETARRRLQRTPDERRTP